MIATLDDYWMGKLRWLVLGERGDPADAERARKDFVGGGFFAPELRVALSELARRSIGTEHEGVVREVCRRHDVKPFDWVRGVVFYRVTSVEETRELMDDRAAVCRLGVLDHDKDDYEPERWDAEYAKPDAVFVARIENLDRDTGVGDIVLDSGRLGLIRERRLASVLPVVRRERVSYDPEGDWKAGRPGSWFA